MNPIVADSCTLILLTKINLLTAVLSRNRIYIPQQVYDETVTKGKEKARSDSFEIDAHVKNKRIILTSVPRKEKEMLERTFGLHAGERDALAIAIQQRAVFLTDDYKARNAANALGMEITGTLGILLTYYEEKN